jgi:hypothetical protein
MFQLTIGVQSKKVSDPNFPKVLQGAITRRLRECGVDLRSYLKADSPHDTGLLRNKNDYAVDDKARNLVVFNRAGYAAYVHEGRGPGKRPPIEALIPWARRHLVNSRITQAIATKAVTGALPRGGMRKVATKDELKQARALAFLIARAIGRRGIKANPWFDRMIEGKGLPRIDRAGSEIAKDIGASAVESVKTKIVDAFKGFAT